MADIKDMIAFYRKRDGLSQTELARKLKVSPSTIGNYEQGTRKPKPEIEEALADIFNVSLDNLRGINTETKRPIYDPKLIELNDKFTKLSKRQQDVVMATIDMFLSGNTQ